MFHSVSIQLGVNGIISFGVEYPHFAAALFPTESSQTYYDFAVAPYWADNDARLYGSVSWEMYSTGDDATTDDIIENVNNFINMNTNETDFTGNFVFVGFWEGMHPYPAGASETQAGPYLNFVSLKSCLLSAKTAVVAITYQTGGLVYTGRAHYYSY